MKGGTSLPSLLTLLVILSPLTVVATNHFDDPIIISVDLENGMVTNQDVIVAGYIENEDLPTSVWWHLSNSDDILASGYLTDVLIEMDVQSSRPRWEFSFIIDVNNIMPCACNLHILAQETLENPIEAVRSLFLHGATQLLPPTIFLDSPGEGSWASGYFLLQGHSFSIGDSEPMLQAKIIQSENTTQCSEQDSTAILDSEEILDKISSVDWVTGSFTSEIDVSGFGDGWHDIFVFASDDDSSDKSESCMRLRIDNTPPESIIRGPDSAIEGSSELLFDSSETDDAVWGRTGINYIWTLRHPSHTGSVPIDVISGHDIRTYSVSTDYSGEFELSLTAIDQAGNLATTTKSFVIENLAPIVRLEIDGESIFDGDSVSLSKSSTTSFDASQSSDTVNDFQSLRYVWRIDNVPIYEGLHRDMSWPEGIENQYELIIEVSDDDGATAILTITVSDAEQRAHIPNSIIVLLGSIGFLLYAVIRRRQTFEAKHQIPKWV